VIDMKTDTRKHPAKTLTLSAMFLALGLVLPFLTGQIPQLGNAFLPMHLPVLLCGLICGWAYGGAVGFILPLLRFVLFGMPPIFPTGVAMAFELAAYGFLAGFLYSRSRWHCIFALYRSLILAMIGGRIVWGVVRILLSGVAGEAFTWKLFLSGAVLNAIPGIILQLILIPAIMVALDRTGLVPFHKPEKKPADA
jgi:riboflavin transporter FmnP